MAAIAVDVAPEVELQQPLAGRRRHAQPPLQPREVLREGYAGRLQRHAAQVLADDEPVVHEAQRRLGAGAEHRQHRVAHLVEAGGRPVAERGERLGQPRRVDRVRAGDVEALLAQHARGAHQEPRDGVVRRREQVAVPARSGDAGPVAAGLREPRRGPRRPGHGGLRARQALEALVVLGHLRPGGERRRVPGAADHDHALAPLALRGADGAPHVGLAQELARRVVGPRGAQLPHRLLDRGERGGGAVAQLDDVLPPPLGVGVAGGGGEGGERVAARPAVLRRVGVARCEERGCRQVDHAHVDAVRERPAERDPLRRERGEGVEDGAGRLGGVVGEQRDRRLHLLVRGQGEQRPGVGRPLDQDGVRLQLLEHRGDGAGGAGAVVADADRSWEPRGSLGQLPTGPIEVLPAVALAGDGLQVLLPGQAVLHRVLDHGAGQPAGHVARPQRAVAEVRRERVAVE